VSTNYVVLGLNYRSHDTSACLMINGELIGACEEERFNKQKHTKEFPINAIKDCLNQSNLSIKDIDEIPFSFNQNLLIYYLIQMILVQFLAICHKPCTFDVNHIFLK